MKMENGKWKINSAIDDSNIVQKSIAHYFQFSILNFPFLRLWPHTFDTEGFFCAIFEKKNGTRDVLPMEDYREKEKELRRSRQEQIENELKKRYGTTFMREGEALHELGEYIVLTNEAVSRFAFPAERYAFGLPFVKIQKDGRIRLSHEIVTLRGNEATSLVFDLTEKQVNDLLAGKDTSCNPLLHGEMILRCRNIPIGLGMAKEGMIKNWLPRRVLQQMV